MQNKIIITRPIKDSVEIALEVSTRGFTPLIEPVLTVEYRPDALPEIATDIPLIFTSSNGVRAFAEKSNGRDHPVYTVGRNTADEARQAGFRNIESASGTIDDLVNLLTSEAKTGLTSAFYIRGRDISGDLKGILAKNGINIDEFIAYNTDQVQNLTVNLLKSLDNREIKAVMLFSSRAGQSFAELIEQYDRTYRMKAIKALCISNAVLESVSALPFGDVLVADKPDRYGMIRLLEKLATAE